MPNLTANSIFLAGPTASGKTAAGIALAERIGAEIISMDSMQLWRGMDIGTAKPTAEERSRVPHHLVDLLDPSESFSVGRYVELACAAADEIAGRGRIPLFVGGTILYMKALTAGLFEGPPADWQIRERLKKLAVEHGSNALHIRLQEADPAAADKIHPNDLRRIVRALEVIEITGKPISEQRREWDVEPPPEFAGRIFALDWNRKQLYERIERRVDIMMQQGLLEEARRLLHRKPPLGREASQAVGYRELFAHLRGETDLQTAVELIKRNTRRFAKRQLTWLRSFPHLNWIAVTPEDTPDAIAERILRVSKQLDQADTTD